MQGAHYSGGPPETNHGGREKLFGWLPLRASAFRRDRRSQQRLLLQLLDLRQARGTVDLRATGELRVAGGCRGPGGLPVQQEDPSPPVLRPMRGRLVLARAGSERQGDDRG